MKDTIIFAVFAMIFIVSLRWVYFSGGYVKIIYKVRQRVKIYRLVGFSLLPRYTYWIYLSLPLCLFSISMLSAILEHPFVQHSLIVIATLVFFSGLFFHPLRLSYVQDRVHDDIARGKRSRADLNLLDSVIRQMREEREKRKRRSQRA